MTERDLVGAMENIFDDAATQLRGYRERLHRHFRLLQTGQMSRDQFHEAIGHDAVTCAFMVSSTLKLYGENLERNAQEAQAARVAQ